MNWYTRYITKNRGHTADAINIKIMATKTPDTEILFHYEPILLKYNYHR